MSEVSSSTVQTYHPNDDSKTHVGDVTNHVNTTQPTHIDPVLAVSAAAPTTNTIQNNQGDDDWTEQDDIELEALAHQPHPMADAPNNRVFNKLRKKLRRQVGQAISEYNMIEDGDVIMACLSGGKDSFTMLDLLLDLQRIAPVKFDVVAVNLDQKQPGFPEDVLPDYLASRNIPFHILEKDTYSVVKKLTPEGKTYCAVCSRLRRGSLYGFAEEIGATKVALGHHRDDMMATLFLNLFHGGSLKSMPPKLLSDDGRNIVIRPLAYVAEKDIIRYAKLREFPIIPCNLCGSQENLQRAMINDMLRDWDAKYPKRLSSIFGAITNVAPSQLADRNLFDFVNLKAERPEIDKDDNQISFINLP